MKKVFLFFASAALFSTDFAQDIKNNPNSNHGNKFEQLGTVLPTPNEYRTASGAPGPKYWQQRCDYNIKATLDEKNLKLTGSETITYYNSSPDVLNYLWLQLDENQHSSINKAKSQCRKKNKSSQSQFSKNCKAFSRRSQKTVVTL